MGIVNRLKKRKKIVALAAIAGSILIPATSLAQADPGGATTLEAMPEAPVNFAWTMMAAFLVFFMQAGFALLESGFARNRNTVNILTKNFMDLCIAGLAFFVFGFALMFGGSAAASGLADGNDVFGYSGFFLTGDAYDVSTIELWFFQMVFAATAATIVSGAMSERTKINAYLAYSFLITALVYPIYGHWLWGGGWLSQLDYGQGALDFAGSGVVHAVGGLSALVGAYFVGPRIGKYDEQGKARRIPGHNMAFVVLGTLILFFGWFGFNAGSTLGSTELRISIIAATTFLSAVAGAVVGFYYSFIRTGKADISLACNGALAGLVGITAPCAFVTPWASIIIGTVAAIVMLVGVSVVENVLKVDDPVGAVSVHGFAGIWGIIALGLFADGTYGDVEGAFYGDTDQLIAQLISAGVLIVWAIGASAVIFGILKRTMGLRVSEEEEAAGLDVSEHGLVSYPQDEPLFAQN